MKLVYQRRDEYNHFYCVHKINELAARTALKDIPDITYSKGYSNSIFATLKTSDVWIQFDKSKEKIKQVLDALKNSGFEFSEMVQKEYDNIINSKPATKPWDKPLEVKAEPNIRYVQWCDKYGCPAINGCGECKRQIYGCHTTLVKVKVGK